MARSRLSILLLIPLLALAGCSEFLNFNAFSSLDTVAAPSASKYEGSGGLDLLASDLNSPSVITALKADPTATAAIEKFLVDTYLSDGITTAADQQAAILYADLNLKTTEGEALVNNVVTTVMSGVPSNTTVHDLLASVLPASALADESVFSAMVTALLDSNTQYLALGASITDVNKNGKIDVGEGVPTGTNMGDVAEKAAVAWTIAVVFEEVKAAVPAALQSDASVIDQMYLLCSNPGSADSGAQAVEPDPYNKSSSSSYVTTNLPSIENIFDCAGLSLPS